MADETSGEAASTGKHRVGTPGVVLIGLGAVAFVICIGGFALGWVGCGTWAGIVALLSSAAGLAWLSDEGRRQRGSRPLIPLKRAGGPPSSG